MSERSDSEHINHLAHIIAACAITAALCGIVAACAWIVRTLLGAG